MVVFVCGLAHLPGRKNRIYRIENCWSKSVDREANFFEKTPFYMTYPLPVYVREEDTILKDLEYLQQLYPADAKKYQKKIV